MKFHELDMTKKKSKNRVGRGISAGQGKTAGRGTKGQNARTGKKLRATFMGGQRTLVRAVPKARGFKSMRTPAQVVYLDHLNAFAGKTVTAQTLFEEGYIASPFLATKVIARGELTEKVNLHIGGASKSVIEAIVKNGGTFVKTPAPLKQSTKEAEASDK